MKYRRADLIELFLDTANNEAQVRGAVCEVDNIISIIERGPTRIPKEK